MKTHHLSRRMPLRLAFLALSAICLLTASSEIEAQDAQRSDFCDNTRNSYNVERRGKRLVTHSELREKTLPAVSGTLSIDGRQNGGVRVEGWDKSEVLVRACVHAAADTEELARELAGRLRVNTENNQVFTEGPANDEERSWAVSYQVFVPRDASVALKTHNGGIGVRGVRGRTEFDAHNGGVSLSDMAGSVRGRTQNGGLSIQLAGNRWEGEGLDVRTQNGGVKLTIPENYSARLETGTVNGNVKVDYPVTVQGRVSKEVSVTLGAGGATVRAMTTNGGVSVRRAGGAE